MAATPTRLRTLSLHDALPIFEGGPETGATSHTRRKRESGRLFARLTGGGRRGGAQHFDYVAGEAGHIIKMLGTDRKSTRLNSSHSSISYAVFCLKKKNRPTPR